MTKNMNILFRFKYPKLILLVAITALSYILFRNDYISNFLLSVGNNYLGFFIAGVFFSFGFTAPFSVAFFIISKPDNLLLASVVGGFGALFGDMLIFTLIKTSFMDEFNYLKKTKSYKFLEEKYQTNVNFKIRNYILFAFAGIIIASPLPDEVGISMLAGFSNISIRLLTLTSFALNTLGILVIMLLFH